MKRYLLISMWRVRPVLLTVIFGTLVFGGNPIPDGQQALYAKYSPLTKEALVSALNDQDSSVRVLAASMLSDEKFIDGAPFILTALGNEPVAGSRVNLAFAAARLGSEDGLKYLQRECGGNPDKEPAIRMLAAQVMIYLQRQECLGSVLEILRAQEDVQITQQALNLLPNFANIPSDKRAEIRSLASALLANRNLITRMVAADTLSKYGDSKSRVVLAGALASEGDANARRALEKALTSLDLRLSQQNP